MLKRNISLGVIVVILSLLCIGQAYKVSDFKPSMLKPSPPSGYHTVETGQQTQGQILCFSDINDDQYNDYVAISSRKPLTLLIYLWDNAKSSFSLDNIDLGAYSGVIGSIEEAIIADLSDDGTPEIIITYSGNSSQANKTYSCIVYSVAACFNMGCRYQPYQIAGLGLSDMTTPPTLINVQGKSSSFLAFKGTERYVVQKTSNNNYNSRSFTQYLNSGPTAFNSVRKHFTSNIDYSGDCHSDLVILAVSSSNKGILQFYHKQTNSHFKFDRQIQFTQPVSFVTFVDFDNSGTVDIVGIKGQTGKEQIFIIYNQNDHPQDLCQQNQKFAFDVAKVKRIAAPYSLQSGAILNFGDIDSDSYPDLLTIANVNDFNKVALYKNTQKDGQRRFQQVKSLNADIIFQVKNPKQVAFFDLGEDGKLDIIVMVGQSTSSGQTLLTRSCFMNNVKDDTLFIKILPLSQTSTYEIGSRKLTSAFGITIQWRITKLDGDKKISLINQKSQWNYGTLQLPFAIGGLGRTNNYVQDLTVGYQAVGQKMSWSPVIPDSKLLVYENNKGVWKLETLLTNNQRVNHVIYVSVVILLILGIVIFFLNYRQNKEDKKDHYNFIQLIR